MRQTIDLSKQQWHLWLDEKAEWEKDTLYPPSDMDLNKMPINPPTIGWEELYAYKNQKEITLPACVEEFYANEDNTYKYHGVSWYSSKISVPHDMKGNRISLHIEKTRLRAEIYVNESLAGYDLVSETPYDVDITDYVQVGKENHIAIRVTNPGGTRGWNDIASYQWGKYEMMPSHDFTMVGHIDLVSHSATYIQDVFVKNMLPAKGNSLQTVAEISSDEPKKVTLKYGISDGGEVVHVVEKTVDIKAGVNIITQDMLVAEAKLWDVDTPNLYTHTLTLIEKEQPLDQVKTTIGFRVFEVKENEAGKSHFYLNGKRFRHKSAIDWGYYAHLGGYTNEEMAEKSVKAAKDIGHNGINFHRQIGEPLVMDKADELGLYMYEEPGGLKSGDFSWIGRLQTKGSKIFVIEKAQLAQELIREKLIRMVLRDRNHPSLLFYNMSNEDKIYSKFRAEMLKLVHDLDGTRMTINSSGTNCTAWCLESVRSMMKKAKVHVAPDKKIKKVGAQYTYKPYDSKVSKEHIDIHTVMAEGRYEEDIFSSHKTIIEEPTRYWGEVGCYCGPSNWYLIAEDYKKLPEGRKGYDNNIYQGMHDKLEKNFEKWNLQGSCQGAIQDKSHVSVQAGRGLMYINGRHCQVMSSYNGNDGFAINGWSSGPQVGSALPANQRMLEDWDSAIVDEGRNLKGPAEDYAYWTRPAQLALFRSNGKYFNVGDESTFRMVLINEGIIPGGNFTLNIYLKDDARTNKKLLTRQIHILGGDVFAQPLADVKVTLDPSLQGGHITVRGELVGLNNEVVAYGDEQILLNNPKSYKTQIEEQKGCIINWQEAAKAVEVAGIFSAEYNEAKDYDVIAVGEVPEVNLFKSVLQKVRQGATMIVPFDQSWADFLYNQGILNQKVLEWGAEQEGFWYGNGWGYVSEYAGQAVPSGSIIPTNGWQPNCDPIGFYPFSSQYKQSVQGLWMARHDVIRVLIGTLEVGKGKILLNASYSIKENDILSQIIFYNMYCNN